MARGKGASKSGRAGGLPTRADIIAFCEGATGKVGKREIARAFDIRGNDKIVLKALLKEMAAEGLLAGDRRALRSTAKLPEVAVIEVVGRDADGELHAEPGEWDRSAEGPPPRILVVPAHRSRDGDPVTPGIGDRLLARLAPIADPGHDGYRFEARPIKRLSREAGQILGIFERDSRGGGVIKPVDRRQLREWRVEAGNDADAADGELVRFDITRQGRIGLPGARVRERLGNPRDERRVSLIAVHAHGIPDAFPDAVLAELDRLPQLRGGKRADMRDLPLLTIDPVDARDHDDAVHAEADTDPDNDGGHVVVVAIADVAHYVRPGSALDREAWKRGNSVYFPDRVVPMLPEKISNDLCSLREGEDRPCLAVRMVFDRNGAKRAHRFERGLMRSAAKLAYEEAQAAVEGRPSERAGPLVESVLKPLWAAYRALAKARDKRGPLDLELPERRIVVGADGRVAKVVVPERLEAHRLIEEMMIQANVAAAETLEAKQTPLLFRVHDEPSKEKLAGLSDFLATLDLALPKGGRLRPAAFNTILAKTRGAEYSDLVNEVVLRSQSQAAYAPGNLGHFGLNLQRYAHFTSPIRRYANLVVHRALIRALGLGADGLTDAEIDRLEETGTAISEAERRAMAAERETADRLIAAHLADRIGATFNGRIAGVTRSGLFVKLAETGADGFIAISTLGAEFFEHVEAAHALVGARSGQSFRLGDRVEVRLVEAVPSAGALRFEMLSEGRKGVLPAGKRLGKRGRHGPPRRF